MSEHFRTIVTPRCSGRQVERGSAILCLGSCFVEAVGERLAACHFDVDVNPAGILYNPLSMAACLRRVVKGEPYRGADLFEHAGLWRSWDHDTSFAAASRATALRRMNRRLAAAHGQLKRLDTLVITFGTACAWFLSDSGGLAANCHTVPAGRFQRRLLAIDEITAAWVPLLEQVLALRPGLGVVLTVSPVRHLRSDAHENSVSKAHLMAAAHVLEQRFEQLYYFPAYEVVMDELRDYRFYGRDRAHLSEEAQDYVWQRFCEACLSHKAQGLVAVLAPLQQAIAHRVQHAGSAAGRAFAVRQLEAVAALERQHPGLRLEAERRHFGRLAGR